MADLDVSVPSTSMSTTDVPAIQWLPVSRHVGKNTFNTTLPYLDIFLADSGNANTLLEDRVSFASGSYKATLTDFVTGEYVVVACFASGLIRNIRCGRSDQFKLTARKCQICCVR